MKLLLDSHTFIWLHIEKRRISPVALNEILSLSNEIFLSLASVWEVQIKVSKGKLRFSEPLSAIVSEQQIVNGLQLLPVYLDHILELENLPPHHKDPFDRLLISQAIVEGMTLVSSDSRFKDYEVNLLW